MLRPNRKKQATGDRGLCLKHELPQLVPSLLWERGGVRDHSRAGNREATACRARAITPTNRSPAMIETR